MYVAVRSARGAELQKRDIATNNPLLVVPADQLANDIYGLDATNSGVFVSSGSGIQDTVEFYPAGSPVHAVDEGSGGGGIATTVTVTVSSVWIGGLQLTCADPATGHIRANAPTPPRQGGATSLTGIAFADGHAFAIYQSSSNQGLARIKPPAGCQP